MRALLLLAVGCATAKPPPVADTVPIEDVEIRIGTIGIGDPCVGQTCAVPFANLSLRSFAKAAKVRLISVGIVGAEGRSLELKAIEPMVWTSRGLYEPWDETIGVDEVAAIRYSLARVDWDHFTDRADVRVSTVNVDVDGHLRTLGGEPGPIEDDDEQ